MNYHSEQLGELAKALALVQNKLEGVEKDANNPFYKSKYADLHSVWQACRIPLSENNLSVSQIDIQVDGKPYLLTMLMHSSGQWMKSYTPLILGKQDMQGYGAAKTYAMRYGLLGIVGLSCYDDDGEEAVKPLRKQPEKPKTTTRTLEDLLNMMIIKNFSAKKDDVQAYLDYIQERTGLSAEDVITNSFNDVDVFIEKLKNRLEKQKGV